MFDINNKEITEGVYVQITGCKVKNDNGIYIVDRKYEGREEYCLLKVKQNGEQAKTKYNIYFLDDRHDTEKQVKIVSKEELKQAAKAVKAYIEGRTAKEVVFTFARSENQSLEGLQEGQVIHFVKCVQWQGHINSQRGKYIVSTMEDGKYRLHLLGAKGDKIADNANGFYQFTPIHLNFKADTMQQLFDENYIEILDRTESTKSEAQQQNTEQPQAQKTVSEPVTIAETETVTEEQQEITNNEQNAEPHTRTIKAAYYPINESNARTAKTINSFYDYTTDEATNAYKNHIAEVETLAQQKAEQHPERADDIQALLNKYSKKYAEWKNRYYAIECMCPSVMVCGAGNFPVRKKEKQNKARDRHMQEYEYIQSILAKIENIGSQREQIKSSDEQAIEKLQAKVDELTADLERAKAMNKYYRKNKAMRGFEGLTDEQATKIDNTIANAYSWDQQPVPSFNLTSIRAKIKTAEGRIAEIKRLKETAEQNTGNQEQSAYKSDVCQVMENTEIMRIQLLFDDVPSADIRNTLKKNGFRWSPSNKAWQRQLTDNARHTTKKVLEQISA